MLEVNQSVRQSVDDRSDDEVWIVHWSHLQLDIWINFQPELLKC